jgi:hypothetical protein
VANSIHMLSQILLMSGSSLPNSKFVIQVENYCMIWREKASKIQHLSLYAAKIYISKTYVRKKNMKEKPRYVESLS